MEGSDIAALQATALAEIAGAADGAALQALRVAYLGRGSGQLNALLRGLGALPAEQRKQAGAAVNAARAAVEEALSARAAALGGGSGAARSQLDLTLPGTGWPCGRLHPVTLTMRRITGIFTALGFAVADGPEVELDYYNFEAINIPATHPARDMHDTFYCGDDVLLRTHTSPVQARVYEKQAPPVRIIAPGKVYRRDYDVTHIPMFHQVEGFWVDEGITFAHLKGMLELFLARFFGSGTRTRFRPSYFPFTEPSAEVDIACVLCGGSGCRVCKQSGWLEVLGCGMVHPAVFAFAQYDSERYTGFAFGMGVERLAMLYYGIDDIRLLYENDLRFLRQFWG